MSSELITHTSDASFNADVIEAGTPVLVDYWAEWCGPCKMIAPILDEVSKDYDGKLRIAKMNVDENRDVPAKYGIRGIPTLMLFKDGQLAATKVGALSKAQLTAFIDSHLTGEAAAGRPRYNLGLTKGSARRRQRAPARDTSRRLAGDPPDRLTASHRVQREADSASPPDLRCLTSRAAPAAALPGHTPPGPPP